MPIDHTIVSAAHDEKNYVRTKLIEYNRDHVPQHLQARYEEINLVVKDSTGRIAGGLISQLCWNWIEVDILWVDPDCRKSGYGSKLLAEIETIAAAKGCTFIKLNTFSFQAPEFYRKNGYVEYACLADAPLGSKHYYFKKDIVH